MFHLTFSILNLHYIVNTGHGVYIGLRIERTGYHTTRIGVTSSTNILKIVLGKNKKFSMKYLQLT